MVQETKAETYTTVMDDYRQGNWEGVPYFRGISTATRLFLLKNRSTGSYVWVDPDGKEAAYLSCYSKEVKELLGIIYLRRSQFILTLKKDLKINAERQKGDPDGLLPWGEAHFKRLRSAIKELSEILAWTTQWCTDSHPDRSFFFTDK